LTPRSKKKGVGGSVIRGKKQISGKKKKGKKRTRIHSREKTTDPLKMPEGSLKEPKRRERGLGSKGGFEQNLGGLTVSIQKHKSKR